ncbi:MAG: hypothetical protein HC838_07190, partial [Spirulinaceae cyanobacterium RM2_2_10]|nr:hypothetical protein [Spirulinaceae cyanobacterium RM2_2_10]
LAPQYTEVGFGYARSPLGRFAFYWTQVLARPATPVDPGRLATGNQAAAQFIDSTRFGRADMAGSLTSSGRLEVAAQALTTETMLPEAAASETTPIALLEIDGTLEDSDLILPVDASRYDLHTFIGTSGQVVMIELASTDFDPYLFLIDPAGEQIAENDDISDSDRNAALTIELPAAGVYSVLVNSYDPDSRGRYRLRVRQRRE